MNPAEENQPDFLLPFWLLFPPSPSASPARFLLAIGPLSPMASEHLPVPQSRALGAGGRPGPSNGNPENAWFSQGGGRLPSFQPTEGRRLTSSLIESTPKTQRRVNPSETPCAPGHSRWQTTRSSGHCRSPDPFQPEAGKMTLTSF